MDEREEERDGGSDKGREDRIPHCLAVLLVQKVTLLRVLKLPATPFHLEYFHKSHKVQAAVELKRAINTWVHPSYSTNINTEPHRR